MSSETFGRVSVAYHRYSKKHVQDRFPQFQVDEIEYAFFELEAGLLMAHRCGITTISVFKNARGSLKRGVVTTDASEKPVLDGKPLEADVIVIATGVWKVEIFQRIAKPIPAIMGINVLYTSTPEGSDDFDMEKIPCWIDHGQGLFGIPFSKGLGVKAAIVIPNTPIDIN